MISTTYNIFFPGTFLALKVLELKVEDIINMGKSKYLNYYLTLQKNKDNPNHLPSLASLQEGYIYYLLELTGNNLAKTAEILNINPDLLLNRLKKHNIRF